ncbi:MAG TPA: polyphosphate kinase 1 [Pyrinomonadaceae bacterium]|nr:polyphosphate kinase 1 [Pyrinomonadaceae bacterium]
MLETVREFVPLAVREETTDISLITPPDVNPFFNRELSWLEFNRRVLNEALDASNPLLERLKFLAIFSTNLDEFFMIRVSGLKEQIAEGVSRLSRDGLSPAEQLREIRDRLRPMLAEQMACLNEDILPALADQGIKIYSYQDLNKSEKKRLDDYFHKNIFPVLTPQAVDLSHPFPFISNLSLNLGLIVEPEEDFQSDKLGHLFTNRRFSRIKLPANVSRLIPIDESGTRFALLGELIAANVGYLFPNMKTGKPCLFRITRDADIEIREDEAGDILSTIELELHHQKRFSFPVRMEVSASMDDEMFNYLAGSIGLTEHDVYRVEGFLNVPDLMKLYALERPELKDKQIAYSIPAAIRRNENIFETLRQRDILLHHPYTAYSSVTDFINAAAEDEQVLAIKICLYRTGKDSPVIKSLVKASRNGKQVAALVELKARFDEENNIEWARYLEAEGVHVVYGMRGMKTHSKVTLVVRSEADELRRYVHIATGNYNPTTSRIYTDLGLLTSDAEIGADATDLFNFLTGYAYQDEFRELLIAPINLRERMIELIRRETENSKAGKEARIIVKINSLTDDKIIRELYRASQAGVKIDLIIRGICTLRPQVAGLSENIRVVSIVGRFLEHSRIFYFANGGDAEIYIGSADWMHRNLDRRVEAVVPIKDASLRQYLKEEVLAAYLQDNTNASILQPDGTYEKISVSEGEIEFDSQMYFVGQEI